MFYIIKNSISFWFFFFFFFFWGWPSDWLFQRRKRNISFKRLLFLRESTRKTFMKKIFGQKLNWKSKLCKVSPLWTIIVTRRLWKSRLVMIFLTKLWVTEIFSFRLVLEGKAVKEITVSSKVEFLETFSVKNFTLSDVEQNISRQLNRWGIADLHFLKTMITSLPELHFWCRKFTLLVQMKEVASMRYGSSTIRWKPWI